MAKEVQSSVFRFHTLGDMVKNNSKKPNKRSQNCKVYKIKYTIRSRESILLLVKCGESYSSKKGHLVYLRVKPSDFKNMRKATLTMPMKYFCSCPAFLYWGSWYNATDKRYLLRGTDKELRKPDKRDPNRENLICKHISATFPHLKGDTLKKSIKGAKNKSKFDDQELSDLEYAKWEDVQATMESLGFNIDEVEEGNLENLLMEKFDL